MPPLASTAMDDPPAIVASGAVTLRLVILLVAPSSSSAVASAGPVSAEAVAPVAGGAVQVVPLHAQPPRMVTLPLNFTVPVSLPEPQR